MIPARKFTDPLPLLVTFVLLSLSACASLSGVFSGNSAGVPPPVSQGLSQSAEERMPAAQLSAPSARPPPDLLNYHCWYLDGRSTSTQFEMTTQTYDRVVDRYQIDLPVPASDGKRFLTIQAQALNGKKDLQLSLSLKDAQGNHRVVAFAGAAAQVGSDRLGAIGMTGPQEDDKTEIFQVDCRRAQ
ncbi:MAG: hypothetical protein H7222_17215 [Methylotenera sp.]|nr:hypothetical protein [Oligoflexia bacterium]